MLNEVGGGLSLALRRWRATASIAVVFAIVCLVTAMILGDVLSQWAALRGGAMLRSENAVVFTPFYPSGEVSAVSPETLTALGEHLTDDEAYSSIINNLSVDDPEFAGGVPTILVSGDVLDRLFPDLGLCSPAPCVSSGAEVMGAPEELILGDVSVPVADDLEPGAVWFDPNAAGLPLDEYLVLRVQPEQLASLDDYATEELVARTVVLAPERSEVSSFVASAARDGLHLVPQDVATEQPQRFRALMVTASMYIVALLAFTLLVTYAYAATSRVIVNHELRAFVIRRMCGATPLGLTVRIASFLAAVILVLPTIMCLGLLMLGPPVDAAARVALFGVSLIYVLLLVLTRRAVLSERYFRA